MFDKTSCLILILLAYILIQNCGQWQGTPLTSLYDIPECGSNLPNFIVRAKHNIISSLAISIQAPLGKVTGIIDLLTKECALTVLWLTITLPEGLNPRELVARRAFCFLNMQQEHGPISYGIAPGAAI